MKKHFNKRFFLFNNMFCFEFLNLNYNLEFFIGKKYT